MSASWSGSSLTWWVQHTFYSLGCSCLPCQEAGRELWILSGGRKGTMNIVRRQEGDYEYYQEAGRELWIMSGGRKGTMNIVRRPEGNYEYCQEAGRELWILSGGRKGTMNIGHGWLRKCTITLYMYVCRCVHCLCIPYSISCSHFLLS